MRLYGSICPIYNREVNDDCRRCGRFYSGNATGIECDSSPMDIPNILKEIRKEDWDMKNVIILTDKELEDLYNKIPKDCKAYHKVMLEYKRLKGIPVNQGANL